MLGIYTLPPFPSQALIIAYVYYCGFSLPVHTKKCITDPAAISESDSNFPFKANHPILRSEH